MEQVGLWLLVILLLVGLGFLLVAGAKVQEEQKAANRIASPNMVCPHCQAKGTVTADPVTVKRGVSGGKATGALLTGGASMLVTGLSQKQQAMSMSCSSCGMKWMIGA